MMPTQPNRAAWRSIVILVAGLAAGPGGALAQSTFQGLGQFPGSLNNSAHNLSGDGKVIAGTITFKDYHRAFRWTELTGFQNLGTLPNFPEESTRAYALSHDGSVIVGTSFGPGGINPKATRWELGGDFVPVGAGMAMACSGDGSVVAGMGSYDANVPHFSLDKAFHWTQPSGYVQLGGGFVPATGLVGSSPDGSNIVGFAINDMGKCFMARWNPSTGFINWFGPSYSFPIAATSSSNDGTVVVGYNGAGATRWTQAMGLVQLGTLPGFPITGVDFSADCSGDGAVVVGSVNNVAFIWDGVHGMRNLREVLISEYGITNLDGWKLILADAITSDGKTIAGTGTNPAGKEEGWIVRLSDQPGCYPDCDATGALNIDDFICYQTLFALGDPAADCDEDGSLTIDDFVCFQTAFAMGC